MDADEDGHHAASRQGQPPPPSTSLRTTDWSLCALCQLETKERLQCPLNSKRGGSTYCTLAENLSSFCELGHLPRDFIDRLSEGSSLKETFEKRKASFHLSCRLQYNSTKLKRKIAAASSSVDAASTEGSGRKFLRRSCADENPRATEIENVCFLCDEKGEEQGLRSASTFQLDKKIRECAVLLQDDKLLAKLSGGDVIAQELKYHTTCLIRLYRKAHPKSHCDEAEKDQMRHGLAFVALTEHMQEVRDTSANRLVVFKLSDLTKMYQRRLEDYGHKDSYLHSTRLKNRLLAHFPGLQAHVSGRDMMLTFAEGLHSKYF